MRYLYYLWIAHGILYSMNLLVGILYLFAGGDQGKFFGLAFIYWAFFIPLSYICWFRPAYKAFKNNSSVLMKTFFIGLSCQFFMCVLHFLGIGGSGSSGIIIGYNVLVSLTIKFIWGLPENEVSGVFNKEPVKTVVQSCAKKYKKIRF